MITKEVLIQGAFFNIAFDCRKYYYFYQSCPPSKTFSEDIFRAAGSAGDRRTLVNVASVSVSLINRWIDKMSQMLSICYSFPTCSKTKNVHLELKLTSSLGLSFIDRKQSKITKAPKTKTNKGTNRKCFKHQFTQTQSRILLQVRVFQQSRFHLNNDSNLLPTHAASLITICLVSHYLSWKSQEPVQELWGKEESCEIMKPTLCIQAGHTQHS